MKIDIKHSHSTLLETKLGYVSTHEVDPATMGTETFSDRMTRSGNTSGFDYLRIVLSVSVLAWHTIAVVYGPSGPPEFIKGSFGFLVRLILPMFFVLSGFLVTSSLMRSKGIFEFVGLRILRLIPALSVEILISGLLIAPLFTSLPLPVYFRDQQFHSYFYNIFGFIHYNLPGVFENNTFSKIVNASLWTIPFELECYIVICFLAVSKIIRYPSLTLGCLVCGCAYIAWRNYSAGTAVLTHDAIQGRMLVAFFLGGVVLNLLSHKIPLSIAMFLVCFAVSCIFVVSQTMAYLSVLPISYITVYLGLQNPTRLPYLFRGDYSYGIYLYAFPIQQATSVLLPSRNYLSIFVVSLLFTSLMAIFSWHVVEKPFLRLKRKLRSAAPMASSSARDLGEEMSKATQVYGGS